MKRLRLMMMTYENYSISIFFKWNVDRDDFITSLNRVLTVLSQSTLAT